MGWGQQACMCISPPFSLPPILISISENTSWLICCHNDTQNTSAPKGDDDSAEDSSASIGVSIFLVEGTVRACCCSQPDLRARSGTVGTSSSSTMTLAFDITTLSVMRSMFQPILDAHICVCAPHCGDSSWMGPTPSETCTLACLHSYVGFKSLLCRVDDAGVAFLIPS